MANEKNLKPFSELAEKEQREIRRKGAFASAKKRREKKTFKELLKIALEMSTKSGNTNAEEIVVSMIRKAQSGDVKAFEAIRDTIGEKPQLTAETITDKQAGYFASRLVKDTSFCSTFGVGHQSFDSFIDQVTRRLHDPVYFNEYLPWMQKHGFV